MDQNFLPMACYAKKNNEVGQPDIILYRDYKWEVIHTYLNGCFLKNETDFPSTSLNYPDFGAV